MGDCYGPRIHSMVPFWFMEGVVVGELKGLT